MYERLIEFRKKEMTGLRLQRGSWACGAIRSAVAYKRGRLSEERYKLLESVGFEWNLLDSNWMKEFQSLKSSLRLKAAGPNGGWSFGYLVLYSTGKTQERTFEQRTYSCVG